MAMRLARWLSTNWMMCAAGSPACDRWNPLWTIWWNVAGAVKTQSDAQSFTPCKAISTPRPRKYRNELNTSGSRHGRVRGRSPGHFHHGLKAGQTVATWALVKPTAGMALWFAGDRPPNIVPPRVSTPMPSRFSVFVFGMRPVFLIIFFVSAIIARRD